MRWFLAFACLCFIATRSSAQEIRPEALLPADALFFMRYDGYEPHRKAYDQTALAKAMKDDLGDFLAYLGTFVTDALAKQLAGEGEETQKLGSVHIGRFVEYLWRHGVVVGFETPTHLAPVLGRWQATLVFPEGGSKKNREVLAPLIEILTSQAEVPLQETRRGQRVLHHSTQGDFAWWVEGNHLVLTFGTESFESILDVIEGRRPSLAATDHFKRLAAFDRYETDTRGYLDLAKVVQLLHAPGETENKVEMIKSALVRRLALSQLGLNGVKSFSFHLGFDRQYQRSTLLLEVAEPKDRKGLLRLVHGPGQFEPKHLPALPPDVSSVSVRHVNWENAYDIGMHLARLVLSGNELVEGRLPRNVLPDIDGELGFAFRKDFLGSLDSTAVIYNSLSEGPFFLGQGLAIKVKDAAKLQSCLDRLDKLLRGWLGEDSQLGFEKKTYRGVEMRVLSGPNQWMMPITYTIHKDWWVLGVYPQSVKGYILRSEGNYSVWKAPALMQEAIALARKDGNPDSRLAAVTVTDPRPSVAVGLSLLPATMQYANLAISELFGSFDVTRIPNAQTINEHLFPDVSLFFDDGHRLRWENHYAIYIPDWSGIGMLMLWSMSSTWH